MNIHRLKTLTDRPLVYLRGCAQVSLSSLSSNFPGEHLADWKHMRVAAEKAYQRAKVTTGNIKVAQTHDCFSISEVIEDIGKIWQGRPRNTMPLQVT